MVYNKAGKILDIHNTTAALRNYVGQFVRNPAVKDIGTKETAAPGTLYYVSSVGYNGHKEECVVVFDFFNMKWRTCPAHFRVSRTLPKVSEEQKMAHVPYLADEPTLFPTKEAVDDALLVGTGIDVLDMKTNSRGGSVQVYTDANGNVLRSLKWIGETEKPSIQKILASMEEA